MDAQVLFPIYEVDEKKCTKIKLNSVEFEKCMLSQETIPVFSGATNKGEPSYVSCCFVSDTKRNPHYGLTTLKNTSYLKQDNAGFPILPAIE
jgi:hypothetical protein